jgi:hypothetical protein
MFRGTPASAVDPGAEPGTKQKPVAEPAANDGTKAPENRDAPQPSDASARSGPEQRAEPVSPDAPREGTTPSGSAHSPEPKANPREDDSKGGLPETPPTPPPPPLTPPAPPPVLPPAPVTPSIDPLPEPVPLTPEAQLGAIADDLRRIVKDAPGTRRADRMGHVLEKVESASARLAKTPPDNQGAIGDLKNAVQKLDAALLEGVITPVERTQFVTRLNAVSTLLKARSA